MKKTLLIALSLLVLVLMSSCISVVDAFTPSLSVVEEPTVYQRTVRFHNYSKSWIRLTVLDGSNVTYDIESDGDQTVDITSTERNVTVTVTGPYFYNYSTKVDLADTEREFPINANAGVIYVKNYLSYTVTDVAYADPNYDYVMYNQSLSIADDNSIPRNETKAITSTVSDGSRDHVYFRNASGVLCYTKGNGMSDKGLYTVPDAGKFITVVLTDNNTGEY